MQNTALIDSLIKCRLDLGLSYGCISFASILVALIPIAIILILLGILLKNKENDTTNTKTIN